METDLDVLNPGSKVNYNLTVTADVPLRGSLTIQFSSINGTTASQSVYITLNIRRPQLQLTPISLVGNVERGSQKIFQMNITNVGEVNAQNVNVTLPQDSRLSLISFNVLSRSTVGQFDIIPASTALLSIGVTSQNSDPLGEMTGNILISSTLTHKSVPYKFFITSLQKVNLTVRVEDEFTYFADGRPLVSDAQVYLTNPMRSFNERRRTTNSTGGCASAVRTNQGGLVNAKFTF